MTVSESTPEILEARAKVEALQKRLDHTLGKDIEAAIQRGDSKEVRRLRDERDDLLCELHGAKVAHKELEIAYAEQMDADCGEEAKRLSDAAQAKQKEKDQIVAESEKMGQAASLMAHHMNRFRDRGYTAIQALAEMKETETRRLREIARQA